MDKDFLTGFMEYPSRSEILDLQFILTDLVEIPINETEQSSTCYLDAMSLAVCQENNFDTSISMGKLVF